jgi:hypothetical protein
MHNAMLQGSSGGEVEYKKRRKMKTGGKKKKKRNKEKKAQDAFDRRRPMWRLLHVTKKLRNDYIPLLTVRCYASHVYHGLDEVQEQNGSCSRRHACDHQCGLALQGSLRTSVTETEMEVEMDIGCATLFHRRYESDLMPLCISRRLGGQNLTSSLLKMLP